MTEGEKANNRRKKGKYEMEEREKIVREQIESENRGNDK